MSKTQSKKIRELQKQIRSLQPSGKTIKTIEPTNTIKKDIAELEAKKEQQGKGVRGFLRRVAINREINEKKGFLKTKDKIRNLKERNEYGKVMVEHNKIKAELNETKKRASVNFEDLFKPMNSTQLKI